MQRTINSFLEHTSTPDASIADNFMVPYEENVTFVGRTRLLQSLDEMLVEVAATQRNHRVALYGMGGIGKTQTALAYVYAHRNHYPWIFWVNADTEASLQSGFEGIAMRIGLAELVTKLQPKQLAERVLLWFRQQESWLLVFDNLDTIEFVNGFLPESGPKKHTLITTRNPNADGIPARGLDATLPEIDEAMGMLYKLSKVAIGIQTEEAGEIVIALDRLPLAIEQAAAYVREAGGNFRTFLKHYANQRAD